MDDAQLEIDRLIEEARREQNAAWYGPAFYSFTPLACDGPNEQCFSFRLAYADATPTAMRASLEEALTYHGCHLDTVSAAVVDGHLVCSAVSQQGKVVIKKARALLRRSQEAARTIQRGEAWPGGRIGTEGGRLCEGLASHKHLTSHPKTARYEAQSSAMIR